MKTWWIVLGSIVLLFLTSSYPMGSHDSVVGSQAPDFALQSEQGKIETPALRGKTLIISFWRSGDAQSRIDNIRYERAVAQAADENICFVSVNLDDDAKLAQNIAKIDGIPSQYLYNANDAVLGNIVEDYNLQDGCCTYMIAPDGTVAAVNPEISNIARI